MAQPSITLAQAAVILSLLSLGVSFTSFGWNIYREIGLKARVKVTVRVMEIRYGERVERKVSFQAVNFGPGDVFLIGLSLRQSWWQRRRTEYKTEFSLLVPEQVTTWSSTLPAKLVVGEQATFLVPYDENCFLARKHSHVGIMDSFRRYHWARKKRLREAEADFRRDFES